MAKHSTGQSAGVDWGAVRRIIYILAGLFVGWLSQLGFVSGEDASQLQADLTGLATSTVLLMAAYFTRPGE